MQRTRQAEVNEKETGVGNGGSWDEGADNETIGKKKRRKNRRESHLKSLISSQAVYKRRISSLRARLNERAYKLSAVSGTG
jgi:hypothetical protein